MMGLIKQLQKKQTEREVKRTGFTVLIIGVLVMIVVDVFLMRMQDKIWRGWNPQWGESELEAMTFGTMRA